MVNPLFRPGPAVASESAAEPAATPGPPFFKKLNAVCRLLPPGGAPPPSVKPDTGPCPGSPPSVGVDVALLDWRLLDFDLPLRFLPDLEDLPDLDDRDLLDRGGPDDADFGENENAMPAFFCGDSMRCGRNALCTWRGAEVAAGGATCDTSDATLVPVLDSGTSGLAARPCGAVLGDKPAPK